MGAASIERLSGPTALILTRQNVPDMNGVSASERRHGVLKGAYIMKKETAALELIIIATGSEVQHAMKAGVSGLWYKYADKVVGVDRFGISAPGNTVMQKFGMTAENLVKEAKAM